MFYRLPKSEFLANTVLNKQMIKKIENINIYILQVLLVIYPQDYSPRFDRSQLNTQREFDKSVIF